MVSDKGPPPDPQISRTYMPPTRSNVLLNQPWGGGGEDLASIASIVRGLNTLSTGSSLIDCDDLVADGRCTVRTLRVVELDQDCGITTF